MVNDSRTLLVVDDEPAILTLMWRLLGGDGYAANWASGATQALELVEATPTPIDLLVTDVVMPGMSGFELATRVQTQHPETKVLFLTGYVRTRDEVLSGLALSQSPFLLKPFTAEALRRTVRSVLSAPDPSEAVDHRRAQRRSTATRVRYRVDGRSTWQTGLARDHSRCGMLLEVAEPIGPQQRLDLSVTPPAVAGQPRSHGKRTYPGYVVRAAETAPCSSFPVGVFVAFDV
jgi:CheY-like chemotaxis protein